LCRAQQPGVLACLLDHLRAQIDADDLACRPHSSGGKKTVQARPAAQVEDSLPRKDFALAQRVADAAKGFGHGGRQGVDLLWVVAEFLSAGRADRKLRLLVGLAGDLGEALLDGSTDFFGGVGHGSSLPSYGHSSRSRVGGITVTVVEVKGNRVRLAFDAPDDVRILRAELGGWHDEPAGSDGPVDPPLRCGEEKVQPPE